MGDVKLKTKLGKTKKISIGVIFCGYAAAAAGDIKKFFHSFRLTSILLAKVCVCVCGCVCVCVCVRERERERECDTESH